MAPRKRRLGVAIVLDPPVADEVNGIRRALGDPSLARVVPHLTLVPPVNVPAARLHDALTCLRHAAAAQPGPLTLTLGPPQTFLPANPVLFLAVGGDLDRLRALRDAVFRPPLERTLSWPWVPHVTLAETATEERIQAALVALDRYAAVATVARVLMLEEAGRTWRPLADAALEPVTVVGTGGLELEMTLGSIVDPEALEMAGEEGFPPAEPPEPRPRPELVLTARREREVVGVAAAWRSGTGAHVAVLVAPSSRSQGIGGHLLAHTETAVRDAGWGCAFLHAHGPHGFYEARSDWSRPVGAAAPLTRTRRRRTSRAS